MVYSFAYILVALWCSTSSVDGKKITRERDCDLSLTSAFSHLTADQSFFVKDNLIWKMKPTKSYEVEYPPQRISDIFGHIPESFDEVFTYGKNFQTYIFKGSYYWRLKTSTLKPDKGYPQPISQGWHGVPDDIDTAFTDQTLQNYFFKDDLVYKYNQDNESVWHGYPKKIKEEFPELTEAKYDTAFHYYIDNVVYFFKGLYHWRMDTNKSITGPYITKYQWKNVCISIVANSVLP